MVKNGMRSVMGDICDTSKAAENRFRDKSGMWDGVTKSRASEVEDLRMILIICLARGCRRLFRADIAGLENMQLRSF